MRKLAITIGCGMILLTMVATVFAQDRETTTYLRSELIGQMDRIIKTYCDVYVGNGYRNASSRCRGNEVVTGMDQHGLYCSAITVECFGKQIVLSPGESH